MPGQDKTNNFSVIYFALTVFSVNCIINLSYFLLRK